MQGSTFNKLLLIANSESFIVIKSEKGWGLFKIFQIEYKIILDILDICIDIGTRGIFANSE